MPTLVTLGNNRKRNKKKRDQGTGIDVTHGKCKQKELYAGLEPATPRLEVWCASHCASRARRLKDEYLANSVYHKDINITKLGRTICNITFTWPVNCL